MNITNIKKLGKELNAKTTYGFSMFYHTFMGNTVKVWNTNPNSFICEVNGECITVDRKRSK